MTRCLLLLLSLLSFERTHGKSNRLSVPHNNKTESGIQFFYYRNGEGNGQLIQTGSKTNLHNYDYAINHQLFVLCHGFRSNHRRFGRELVSAFRNLSKTRKIPINVIVINWRRFATGRYAVVVGNVGPVGMEIASLLRYLIDQNYTTLKLIHFIGHSLGSHVGNYVGNALNSNRGKIARITALDPALPLFGFPDETTRIDPGDAEFVDVIHTAKGKLGFAEPRGHVDFYPNDGASPQPGCSREPWYFKLLPPIFLLFKKFKKHTCSHSRATRYFAESIRNPDAFYGCRCKSWREYSNGRCKCNDEVRMGLGTPNTAPRGIYYLRTNSASPFGRGSHNASLATTKSRKTKHVHLKRKNKKRRNLEILEM